MQISTVQFLYLVKQTLKEADNALLERSLSKLKSSLTSSHLKLLNINLDNLESYLDALLKLHEEKQVFIIDISIFSMTVL